MGLDSSPNMITSAKSSYSTLNTTYAVQDCRDLSSIPSNQYSKIFSNAAFHWILRCPTPIRSQIFLDCFRALKPGGKIVAEMGGQGNVGEVHAALISALMHHGFSAEQAREANPWFFPDEAEIRGMLERAGLKVEMTEMELRQTVLTEEGGLEGWVRLFGAKFLEAVKEEEREAVVKEVCDVLEGVGRRADGKFVLGYIRLRFVGVKEA
jgi:trans-aconitate methyltransferase